MPGRDALYRILMIACVAGYAWLLFLGNAVSLASGGFKGCLFKWVTGWPCPSCGSTRAVRAFFYGQWAELIHYNLLGILVAMIMVISPFWIVGDWLFHSDSLFSCYCRIENCLRKKAVALVAIALVLVNWIWVIIRDL